jgi:hypothetical protein
MKMPVVIKIKLTIILLLLCFELFSKEAVSNEDQNSQQQTTQQQNSEVKIPFVADSEILAKNATGANLEWIDVQQQSHLVFKRPYNGNVFRGNAILFHTQGENPKHTRLIDPLSQQLANFGWNTYSPNIGIADLPKRLVQPTTPAVEPATTNSTEQTNSQQPNQTNNTSNSEQTNDKNSNTDDQGKTELEPLELVATQYFENEQKYQEYFTAVCQETTKLVAESIQPTIMISTNESSYWILECISQMPQQTPLILIGPEVPIFAQEKLDSALKNLDQPLYTFVVANQPKRNFVRLIENRKNSARIQRHNNSAMINSRLNSDNTNMAKLISGWVKTLSIVN